jgi:AraC-like DNA-binding protein
VKLFIKNMVCDRCIMVVRAELERMGLHPGSVQLGLADLAEESLNPEQEASVSSRLEQIGFELLKDRKQQVIEAIKTTVIDLVHRLNDETNLKHSEYIAQQLHYDYPYLSKLFSDEEGITIEQYIIQQKIERVKELLAYGELTLSEIAYRMGYSSVAALSAQFKKVLGITPSEWKAGDEKKRKPLDKIGKS